VSAKRAQSKGFAKPSSAAPKAPAKASAAKPASAPGAPVESPSTSRRHAPMAKASAPVPAERRTTSTVFQKEEEEVSPSSGFGWSSRIAKYFDTHPGFTATLPPEAETWHDADLNVYFGSNGDIWPRGKRPSWIQGKKSTFDAGNQPPKHKTYPELKEHFLTLDLPESVPPDHIKRHYRRLALICHPDKNPDDVEGARKRFQEITTAYEAIRERLKF